MRSVKIEWPNAAIDLLSLSRSAIAAIPSATSVERNRREVVVKLVIAVNAIELVLCKK